VFNGVENTEEEFRLSNGGMEMGVNGGVIDLGVSGERVESEMGFEKKGYGFREEGCGRRSE